MPETKSNTIRLSNETYKRVKAFKEVIEAVMDEKYEMDEFIEGLLDNGINLLLERLWEKVSQETLVQSLQQLGTKYPVEIYGYIAETLLRGAEINKEELKERIGFLPER